MAHNIPKSFRDRFHNGKRFKQGFVRIGKGARVGFVTTVRGARALKQDVKEFREQREQIGTLKREKKIAKLKQQAEIQKQKEEISRLKEQIRQRRRGFLTRRKGASI